MSKSFTLDKEKNENRRIKELKELENYQNERIKDAIQLQKQMLIENQKIMAMGACKIKSSSIPLFELEAAQRAAEEGVELSNVKGQEMENVGSFDPLYYQKIAYFKEELDKDDALFDFRDEQVKLYG